MRLIQWRCPLIHLFSPSVGSLLPAMPSLNVLQLNKCYQANEPSKVAGVIFVAPPDPPATLKLLFGES